ncbi:MAG: endonuclease MutS2, partial [Gemmatimonadetes bacterium]|nr:endonuclease MutS2 [Gemmatimonadota bacterium]
MDHALGILEFDRALEFVAKFAASRVGRARIQALRPCTDPTRVDRELAAVQEVLTRIQGATEAGLPSFPDGEEALARLEIDGSVLTPDELWSIGVLLEVGRVVSVTWEAEEGEAPLLAELVGRLKGNEPLEKRILRSVDGDGAVLDTASKELAGLRQKLQGRHTRVVRHLETVLDGLDSAHRVSDASVTIREGRYVIPVRREGKGRVGGYVHDESASGATLFVEPPSAIELMNEIRGLEREEVREVQRVLRELTDACRPEADGLKASVDALAELDSRRARALAARAWDGARPTVTDWEGGAGEGSILDIRSGRYPLLLTSGVDVVPFDLHLEDGERLVLVSGPNTGGKTVFLKSIGLISALTQSGIIPPVAPGSRLPVFGSYYADVGDEQSIAQSLSTFSAHLKNLREIVDRAGPGSLVLMDELGTGTDPKEGEALSRAILETLADAGCVAVVTSHLGGLRRIAAEGSGVVNASMQFDADHMAPSYQFRKGRPGRSYGLAIARGLGFPGELLDRAETYRDEAEARLDDVLQSLEAKEREAAQLA